MTIRFAARADTPAIAELIRALADYEKLAHQVTGSEAALAEHLFGARPFAEVLLAEEGPQVVGFALFFHNFSTFLAKPGLYLEDLFVRPEARGRGHGKALLVRLAQIARERACGRLEWAVLDWNAPAIAFYRSLGAEVLAEWTVNRLTGQALATLAAAE
jgi:GNAT superfamily N-acetyltransferase